MTGTLSVGIIEGFYGPPWRHVDRLRAIRFLGDIGAGTYVYAPKNDPLHRDRWRDPYLDAEWARFGELLEAGAAAGVGIWFGLTPIGIDVTVDADVDALRAKLAAAVDAGFERFCLLADDTPESFVSSAAAHRFATLPAMHAHLVAEAYAALDIGGTQERQLSFVPQRYHGDPADPYITEIGALLPPDVAVMWTGPEVCSETIDTTHLDEVARRLRRPVVLWDNHPVNDGAMARDPHLGPLTGRPTTATASLAGILANVALQPESSLIAVATVAAYARSPEDYDPARAWREALSAVAGDPGDVDALAVLAELSPRSPLWRRDPLDNRLAEPLRRFTAAWEGGTGDRAAAHEAIRQLLEDLQEVAEHLAYGLRNDRLREDLAPWSQLLLQQLVAARACLDVLRVVAAGGVAPEPARARALDLVLDLQRADVYVAGDQLERLGRCCLRAVAELDDGTALPPEEPA